MRRRLGVLLAAAAAALACASAVSAGAARDAAVARRGIAHALRQHWLKAPDAQRYRAAVARAVWDTRRLPPLRGRVIDSQLAQLTTLWDSYTSPRALALFSQLEENLSYLETHRIPAERTDVSGDDGVVYRWFGGLGLEFHPLASFGALNGLAAAENADATRTLADALLARAIPRGRRLIWEYAFPFGFGRPPWASGMAQAVAAQALARSGALLQDPALVSAAARAYASVPPLVLTLPSGPWIRLYGFDREVVLNAQLQAILSLGEYAQASGDADASALAQRMTAAVQTLLPRFDTGDWSLYELGGAYAPKEYEVFVTDVLAKLAARTQDPFWTAAARRFSDYLYTAPQVSVGALPPELWPQPQDGYLDAAPIPVTLSQRASVSLAVAGQVTTWRLGAGPHVLTWRPPATLPQGTYPAQLSATSYAGNRSTTQLGPFVVRWETTPPQDLTGTLAGSTLTWSATDPGTPWLALKLDLADPSGASAPQALDLGRLPASGSTTVTLPPGTWQATLEATSSAGLTATFPLGTVTAPG